MKNFNDVQSFFISWGLYPSEENTDDYNPDVIIQGINKACFEKLQSEAKSKYGDEFLKWVDNQVDCINDAFHLDCLTWNELEHISNAFFKSVLNDNEKLYIALEKANEILIDYQCDDIEHEIKYHPDSITERFRKISYGVDKALDILQEIIQEKK